MYRIESCSNSGPPLFAIVLCLTFTILDNTGCSNGYAIDEHNDPVLEAVYDYLQASAPDLTDLEKEVLCRERRVEEITGWPFQDRLKHHRLFYYPKTNLQSGVYIVSVDAKKSVTALDDIDDFNRILQDECVHIRTAEDAAWIAQLFLKVYYSWGSLYLGYELGVNVIREIDDIEFADETERDTIVSECHVLPPSIEDQNGTFTYRLWSWEKDGSGRLETHEVVVNETGIVTLKRTFVKGGVGLWVGLR